MADWFTDIRRTALATSIAMVLSVLIPLWNAAGTISGTARTHSLPALVPWIVLIFAYLFTAILPVFFFVLYRSGVSLHLTNRLRYLALAAALITGVFMIAALPGWIRSLHSYWSATSWLVWTAKSKNLWAVARDPVTISHLSTALGFSSSVAYILFLVAVFRAVDEPPQTSIATSQALNRVAKVAVIAWGLVLIFICLVFLFTPITFIQLRDIALQNERQPPLLRAMVLKNSRTLLDQAAMLAAPYIVFRSQSLRLWRSKQ